MYPVDYNHGDFGCFEARQVKSDKLLSQLLRGLLQNVDLTNQLQRNLAVRIAANSIVINLSALDTESVLVILLVSYLPVRKNLKKRID